MTNLITTKFLSNIILMDEYSEAEASHLLDRLRSVSKGELPEPNADQIFDKLLNFIAWNPKTVLQLGDIEGFLRLHFHVGIERALPEGRISKRSLPDTPTNAPWLRLLKFPESVNSILESLGIDGSLTTRVRREAVYPPTGSATKQSQEASLEVSEEELVMVTRNGCTHPISSLGSGVAVILPVLVALTASNVELLSIEEPESHVHPRLQAALGDAIIESAAGSFFEDDETTFEKILGELYCDGGGVQPYGFITGCRFGRHVLIETHSEHLILRILRRIREVGEGKIDEWPKNLRESCPRGFPAGDVCVIYVEPGADNGGGSRVIHLPVTSDGDFARPWPSGFFTERAEEL